MINFKNKHEGNLGFVKAISSVIFFATIICGMLYFNGELNSIDLSKFINNIKVPEINIDFDNNGDNTSTTNGGTVTEEEVNNLLNTVTIAPDNYDVYNRDDYTSSTQSYEYNGKHYDSIRKYGYDASIFNDGTNYNDPYTGENIELSKCDWDHIIPLHYANQHGASNWTAEEKKAFADNPNVGVNVNASDNRSKSDRGPSEWLPDVNRESYCYTWLVIANDFNLSINQEDYNVIKDVLSNVKDYSTIINLSSHN